MAALDRSIHGIHPVATWVQAHPEHVRDLHYDARLGARLAQTLDIAARAGVRVQAASDDTLTRMAGTPRHQGIVAQVGPFPYVEIEQICATQTPLVLLADQIQDPHNLGAMLRTAEAVGAGGVLIPKDSAVGVSATVEVAAAGAAALVPVSRVTNAVRALEQFKQAGYWIVGLVAHGATSLYSFDPPDRLVVVVGGETGMRPLVARQCDFTVSIPMYGKVESLNASVATAVVLYELTRRRRASGIVSRGGAV